MKPKVYLETTVISYLTALPSRDIVQAAHQQITREWWARRHRFELFVLSLALVAPSVTIGGAGSQASFTGLAPDFVGLYQVNAQVPFGSVSGNAVPLTLMFPDGSSNTVTIAVE